MSPAILMFIVFLAAGSVVCCSCEEANITFGCIAEERNALIKFKASFSDPDNKLSSWNISTQVDCCEWQGVRCDAITGHVIGLDLRNQDCDVDLNFFNMLVSEKLDSSIEELKRLSFLDMSGNDFWSSSIPAFIGSMNHLQHLNLSYANFSGAVPHRLGNLTRLRVLDLSYNDITDDLMWLSRLSSLTLLSMSGVDISGTKHLLKVLYMLPNLVDLSLSYCGLENKDLLPACLINSTRLLPNIQYLDLSYNSFQGELPCFLENMTTLIGLDLSHNSYNSCNQFHLTGLTNIVHLHLSNNSYQNVDSISEFLSNKCYLESLDLGGNFLSGDVSRLFHLNSSSCWNQKLATLYLPWNKFYGQLPEEIGRFRKLEYLDLGANFITGTIPTSISNLSLLAELNLSGNKLNGSIPASFGNLTSLKLLNLGDNLLGGEIPTSLGQLQNLETLTIGHNYFHGIISEAHFAKLSMLDTLSMEKNLIKVRVKSDWRPPFQLVNLNIESCEINGGQFPKWLQTQKELVTLNMRNCSISGPLPNWLRYKNMTYLYLSDNRISGYIPDSFCEMTSLIIVDMSNNRINGYIPESIHEMTSLFFVDMSNNHIGGSLPNSLCEMTNLYILDLSMNRISGILPECSWANLTLYALSLSSNQLSGVIPNTFGQACPLAWLQLNNNSLRGELPSTLRNCIKLQVLHIGENVISGNIPKWIGMYLLELKVLRLVKNELYSTIPVELCQLSQMHILDVANNKLTGDIPRCFGNLSGMIVYESTEHSSYTSSVQLVMKGVELEYFSTLYVVNMDLSSNALEGGIPLELTRLVNLRGLNLAHNYLHGMIPGSIGDMKSLESLDLSSNNLFGNIPGNLSGPTSLSYLNLSYNDLTGQIPTGNQLQTLVDPWIYEGNAGLCGDPLPRKCHDNKATSTPTAVTQTEDDDKLDMIWFYGVVISGFVTGFWGFIGVLVFKRGWRFTYFKFVDDITARIFGRY